MTDYTRMILEETAKLTSLADSDKAELLNRYYELVVDYNENVNLTAITEPVDFLQKHFLDSLALIADRDVSRETKESLETAGNVSRETSEKPECANNEARKANDSSESAVNASRETKKCVEKAGNVSRETTLKQECANNEVRKANDSPETAENVSRETKESLETAGHVSRETKESLETAGNVSRETMLRHGARLIDVGTGAGFPGIPLAIFRPDVHVTLMDSLNKRVTFLNNTVNELGLANCDAVHARAEDLAHNVKYREQYDICVSRAVAALPVLCEYCLPFVKKGGLFVSYKASGSEQELKEADKAIKTLGGRLFAVKTVHLPGTDIVRKLIIIKKTQETPKKYPRKAGTPAKQPL